MQEGTIRLLQFSPDGKSLLTNGPDGAARLWDIWGEKFVDQSGGPGSTVISADFRFDGKLIVIGENDGFARFWEVATGRFMGPSLKHRGPVQAVEFSRDGQTVLTSSSDGTARLWSAADGSPVGPHIRHDGDGHVVALGPDGQFILAGSRTQAAQLWDTATGIAVGPSIKHSGALRAVAFSPDGRTMATADDQGMIHLRSVPLPIDGLPKQISAATEVLTGLYLSDENSTFSHFTDDWRERSRVLSSLGGPPARAFNLQLWHHREAVSSERECRWHAAQWHLEQMEAELNDRALRQARLYRAYREQNKAKEALDAATQSILEAPDNYVPYFNRGVIFSRLARWDQALADFSASLERNETDWQVWFERAWVHAQRASYKDAISDLDRSVALPGAYSDVWSARALLYLATGDEDRYRKSCAELVAETDKRKLFATVTWEEYQRQASHLLSSRIERFGPFWIRDAWPEKMPSVESYGITVWDEHHGKQQWYKSRGDHFNSMMLGEQNARDAWACCLGRGGLTDYMPLVNRMRDRMGHLPNSYSFVRAYGAVLYRAKQFDAAQRELNRALQLRPQPSPATWLVLALTEYHLNKPREGLQWLSRASTWIKEAKQASPQGNPPRSTWDRLPWTEQVALTALQREAEAIFQDALRQEPPKTDESSKANAHATNAPSKKPTPNAVSAPAENNADLPVAKPARNCGQHEGRATCVVYSADGKRALSGGYDKTILLWDIEKGQEVRHFDGHTHVIWTVALSNDGRLALSGSQDQTVRLWNVETGKEVCPTMKGHSGVISSVAFLSDGKQALSASWDKTVRFWDLETGKEVRQLAIGACIFSMALTKEGQHVLLGSDDGKLRYWDLRTKREVRAFAGPAGVVEGLTLTGDARQALVAGADGVVRIYDVEAGKEIKPLKGHRAKVDCVSLSPDGSRILSCGEDKTIRVWDLANGRELWRGQVSDKLRWAAFSPDGKRAVSACYDGSVALWELPQ
jgi:WD40 repeat protein